MSAITGIFLRNGGSVDFKSIKKMNDRLNHRGPDGASVFVDGPVALGHQMLHTTPESLHEKLPFEDETSGMVITADARIDNRGELSHLLELDNSENVPDSAFILKAYQKWGENCPQNLLGDFVFAIWDPDKKHLFCARDHMGIKPFYYYVSDDIFYFASEMKAIRTFPDVPHRLNELKIAFYLKFVIKDKELTFYEDILRLPGATSMKIDDQMHVIKKYWELDPDLRIKMDSEEEYINAFREIFREAIICRLRSAFPVGFQLSGGLDSSSIVCMSKKILNEKDPHFTHIETFSYVTDGVPQINERYYIEKVVDTGGIQPNFIDGDKISPFEEIDTMLQHQDQPFFSPHLSIFRSLCKKMHEKNIRICFNGYGGDHISAIGPGYLKKLFLSLKWKLLLKEINCLSKRTNQNIFDIFLKNVIFYLIPAKIREIILNNFTFRDNIRNNILNKNFSNRLGGEKYFRKIFREKQDAADNPRKYHYWFITAPDIQSTNESEDLEASKFYIESRSPFTDKRIVEFCYAVPTEIKFKNGWNRYLHRAAMKDIIPRQVQCNPIKRSGPPISDRSLLFFEKDCLDKIIKIDNKLLADYVDLNFMKEEYEKYQLGMRYISLYIWFISNLYFWLRNTDIQQ